MFYQYYWEFLIYVAEILRSEEFSAALSVLCFGSNKRMFNTLYKYIFKILSLWLNFFKLLLFFLLTDFLWEDFVRLFTMARYFGQHDMTEDSRQGFELSPSESTPFEGEFVYSGRYMRGCSRSEYCSCADILSYGVRAFVCVIALFAWLWPCEVFLCIIVLCVWLNSFLCFTGYLYSVRHLQGKYTTKDMPYGTLSPHMHTHTHIPRRYSSTSHRTIFTLFVTLRHCSEVGTTRNVRIQKERLTRITNECWVSPKTQSLQGGNEQGKGIYMLSLDNHEII